MTVFTNDSVSLLDLRSMINASPLLHKLTLKVRRIIQTAPKCTHQHLKIVELDGFSGLPIDFEFVLYLLENAVMLEKITIKPDYRYPTKGWPKQVAVLEEAVRHLQTKVPQGV